MATRLPQLPPLSLSLPPSPSPPPPPPPPPSSPPQQQIIISPPRTCISGVDTCSPLCPNLCPSSYTRYPDDPSATPSGSSSSLSPLLIALISILAAAFLLVSYYALSTSSFFRRNNRGSGGSASADPAVEALQSQSQPLDPNTGLGESMINRIALLKYRRNDGLVVSTDCSVCLGEFKEDESLRLLPECTHAFHVECIDKWLESHSNCPICRASVISVPQPVQAREVPRVQPRERENRGSGDNNNNNVNNSDNNNNTGNNGRTDGGNNGISNSNPPLVRGERRNGGLVVIVDPGPVGRVQEIIEVGEDSIRPVSRHPTFVARETKPLKSSLVR